MNGKVVYSDGILTCTLLTDEEAAAYRSMIPGVRQTSEMIQWVAENDEEKQILEFTANGMNRIRVKKNQGNNISD